MIQWLNEYIYEWIIAWINEHGNESEVMDVLK